jgi:hypothetical protein
MSNVSYAQALSILSKWTGSAARKAVQWQQTYNYIDPPPPGALVDDPALALYISDNYTGPVIPGDD